MRKNNVLIYQAFIFSVLSVFISFVWQGDKGFSLWDEGYLWYGAQRVMLFDVPIRDFLAYDPGRYYWSAVFMSVMGDNGIMSLRSSVAIFQAIGLFVGMFLIVHANKKQNLLYLFLSVIILMVWMYPRHKLFDVSSSIFLIGILAFLIQKPTGRRFFYTGLCVGFLAVFGRNHGVYGAVASAGVMLWLNIKKDDDVELLKGFGKWCVGIIVGFSPVLFMVLLVPDFGAAFWESIRLLIETKSTNLPLAVPWPWKVDILSTSLDTVVRGLLIGLFFIGTVAFGLLTLAWVIWQKYQNKYVPPQLVATSFLALPYAHFAFSRADLGHLSQGVFPLLLGSLIIISSQPVKVKWSLVIVLCVSSIWVMYIYHPAWYCHAGKQCVNVDISDNELLVRKSTASDIKLLHDLADQYAPNGQSFIAVPFWPGAYPLLERRSPLWEIYPILPRNEVFEENEIQRLKNENLGFAIIFNLPLDGREDLRFHNTHPLTYQYINKNFKQLPPVSNTAYQIYIAKEKE